jgi:signal transduction histidine kinase
LARLLERSDEAPSDEGVRQRAPGLRLAICKALVSAMGGEIQATSSPSVGSAFTVRLPLERAPHCA